MKKSAFILSIIALAFIVSCSAEVSPTAIIRVTLGEPPQLQVDKYAVEDAEDVFTSYDYSMYIDDKLGLSKLWGISDIEVHRKLLNAIKVKAGNVPGLVVITCNGQEHELAVKIVNELCVFATKLKSEVSHNGDNPQAIHVEIIQPAK